MRAIARLLWTSAGLLAAATLVACVPGGTPSPFRATPTGTSNGFGAALTHVVRPGGPPGGTLRLGSAADCPGWDPARTDLAWCWDVQRTFTRQLLAFAAQPGVFGTQVVPDLAASLGQADEASTVWTYRLRPGLAWEDGTPITAAQVAAGIRRLFRVEAARADRPGDPVAACVADGRCQYPRAHSPVAPPAGTVETPDTTTVVVRLSAPDPSFDYRMALPAAAPVRGVPGPVAGVPMASGPYRAESYRAGDRLVLVRNPQWDQALDPVRGPRVDRIALRLLSDQAAVDRLLADGELDLDARGSPGEAFSTVLLSDPELVGDVDIAPDGSLVFLALFTAAPPLDSVACRRALFYAIDRVQVAQALGPATIVSRAATSLTPPTMAAYDSGFDPYRITPGNPDPARAELAGCGKPDGFALPVGYLPQRAGTGLVDALAESFAPVGVRVVAEPGVATTFYPRTIGSPASVARHGPAAGLVSWAVPTPDVAAWWTPVAGSGSVRPTGNVNYALLSRPVVDDLLASTEAGSTDLGAQTDVGRVTDRLVMGEAVYLPVAYGRSVLYRNPRLTDVMVSYGLGGLYDLVTIGVGGRE